MMETSEFHGMYKGYYIFKVTQDSGRVTYDIYTSKQPVMFNALELGVERLAVAKAIISSEVSQ